MSNYVVVAGLYIDDGWYGRRIRYILQPETDVNFSTKTEANKWMGKLKKHMKALSQDCTNDVKMESVTVNVAEMETLKEYTYHSFGPSISYKHKFLTPEQLLIPMNREALKEKERWGM